MPNWALRDYIRIYEGALDAGVCRRLVESFEGQPRLQRPHGGDDRPGLESSHWTALNVSAVADRNFVARFRKLIGAALEQYNLELGLGIPVPNSQLHGDLVIKRYEPGGHDRFQLHYDSVNRAANRYLVFLWYLNDVYEGGETAFPYLGLRVAARAGRLLMFPPYWMYQHEGIAPRSNAKFILSTYLLFDQS